MKTEKDLIAEFMGVTILDDGKYKEYVIDEIFFREREIKYDTSWDWLMPVVEKIENNKFFDYTFGVTIDRRYCEISYTTRLTGSKKLSPIRYDSLSQKKIDIVYKVVVNFIHWYNTQKQTP